MFKKIILHILLILLLSKGSTALSQDKRTQYPPILANSYVGVSIGYINYPFSALQLEPGYTAKEIRIPHVAVRIILFGHRFNDHLSAQISYMRPVEWVEYNDVNGDGESHKVGMNVAGLTIKSKIKLAKNISIYGEGGLGVITRGGFIIDDNVVVRDVNYASLLLGAGLQYKLNKNWELLLGTAWSPAKNKVKQPSTVFYSAGFNYTMQKLSAAKLDRNNKSGYIFPGHLLQVGYTTNGWGYGVNDFVSKKIPIFWGGNVHVARGIAFHYQQNLFHTRKVFGLDWGTSLSFYRSSLNRDDFFTFSLFPVFRFIALRSQAADLYLNYSLAGPTFISKPLIDSKTTGKRFTFQDFMGMGIFTGKKRNLNAELRIMHYSNGNIFPKNEGVKIPLTFNVGWAF